MARRSRRRVNIFESATVRLTLWYTSFVMALSILFSVVLYSVTTNEVQRLLEPRRPGEVRIFVGNSTSGDALQSRVQESTTRLVLNLVVFNLSVLVAGMALSYFLAKRTLEPIERAHEAQARFTSDAAHELRTPLASMQTEIEVALRSSKSSAQQYKEVLGSNLEEVERLRTLTDRLLLLASQQALALSTVDVEAAAVEAVTHVVSLAQERSIAVDNQVAPTSATGHFESIVTILGILLDNAIKYSPAKTTVTLEVVRRDERVEIVVRDEGPGVPKEDQVKIFERFYRADVSRSKENVEGHGLGLSLARRLAEEMNGTLRVESEPGRGAAFVLTLPISGYN